MARFIALCLAAGFTSMVVYASTSGEASPSVLGILAFLAVAYGLGAVYPRRCQCQGHKD